MAWAIENPAVGKRATAAPRRYAISHDAVKCMDRALSSTQQALQKLGECLRSNQSFQASKTKIPVQAARVTIVHHRSEACGISRFQGRLHPLQAINPFILTSTREARHCRLLLRTSHLPSFLRFARQAWAGWWCCGHHMRFRSRCQHRLYLLRERSFAFAHRTALRRSLEAGRYMRFFRPCRQEPEGW